MPPRWPRKPDRNDPEYRRLEDRINFAVHVGLFCAFNSGLWFFQILLNKWDHLELLTGIWLALLVGHGVFVFTIADYSPNPDYNPSSDYNSDPD